MRSAVDPSSEHGIAVVLNSQLLELPVQTCVRSNPSALLHKSAYAAPPPDKKLFTADVSVG